ncbi:hypothetical protein [Jeongeupia naejangsanensis]|uniref:Uncharacterized protein n=1 Tax=Jeongeupia naejangsanensis TaxID=613195 RepID=A0ABS2BJK1_9NEIS|nr:hypothetical protein [Jeongeupia naejangsanensis]MBM3115788.1 hypothetical protein [Jeongeupia naejangsanensis]
MADMNALRLELDSFLEQAKLKDDATRALMLKSANEAYQLIKLFESGETDPAKLAGNALNCIGNMASVAVAFGGGPLAEGVVMVVGLLTKILGLFNPTPSPDLMAQLTKLLQDLKADEVKSDIRAVCNTIDVILSKLTAESVKSGSLSTGQITDLSDGNNTVAQYALDKAGQWLALPGSFSNEHWENLFVGWAYVVLKDFYLMLLMVDRASARHEKEDPSLPIPKAVYQAALAERAAQLAEKLDAMAEHLAKYGDYYATSRHDTITGVRFYGYSLQQLQDLHPLKNGQAPQALTENWQDADLGSFVPGVEGYPLAINAQTRRVWAVNSQGLHCGFSGQMQQLPSDTGRIDVSLLPAPVKNGNDLVLSVSPDGGVYLDQWNEAQQKLVAPTLHAQIAGQGRIVSARFFRAPVGLTYQDLIYIVRVNAATDWHEDASATVELQYLSVAALLASANAAATPTTLHAFQTLTQGQWDGSHNLHNNDKAYVGIAVSDDFCFVHFQQRLVITQPDAKKKLSALHYIRHADLLNRAQSAQWTDLPLPGSLAFGTPREDGGMAIRGINSVQACANDMLVMSADWQRDNSYGSNTDGDLDNQFFHLRQRDGKWAFTQIGGDGYFITKRNRESWTMYLQLQQLARSFATQPNEALRATEHQPSDALA